MTWQGISEEILAKVKKPWREQFARFIETGDLDPDFEAFLDTDEECQKAVEEAVEAQARSLESFGRAVRGESSPALEDAEMVDTVARLGDVIRNIQHIRPERRHAAAQMISGALRSARSSEERNALKEVFAPVEQFLKA